MTTLNRNNSNWSFEERRKINENWEILESISNSSANNNNGLKQELEGLKVEVSRNATRSREAQQIANQAKVESSSISDIANQAKTKSERAIIDSAQAKNIADESKLTAESVQSQFNQVVAEAGSNNPEVVSSRVDSESGESFVSLPQRLDQQHKTVSEQLNKTERKVEGIVSVKEFGAIGDGSDATQAFKDALSTLSSKGTLLIPEGRYLLTSRIEITCNVECRGEILIPNNVSGTIINIPREESLKVAGNALFDSMTKGDVSLKLVNSPPIPKIDLINYFYHINSTEFLIDRLGSDRYTPYTKNETGEFKVLRNALVFGKTPLLYTYNDLANVEVLLSKKSEQIVINNLRIIRVEAGTNQANQRILVVNRNNVKFNNFYYDNTTTTTAANVVTLENTANIEFSGTIKNVSGEGDTYAILNTNSSYINIHNYTYEENKEGSAKGYSGRHGSYVTFNECEMYGIDDHWGNYYTVKNSKINSRGISYAGGNIDIINTDFYDCFQAFTIRADTPYAEGKFTYDNCRFYNTARPFYYRLQVTDPLNRVPANTQKCFDEIEIKNCTRINSFNNSSESTPVINTGSYSNRYFFRSDTVGSAYNGVVSIGKMKFYNNDFDAGLVSLGRNISFNIKKMEFDKMKIETYPGTGVSVLGGILRAVGVHTLGDVEISNCENGSVSVDDISGTVTPAIGKISHTNCVFNNDSLGITSRSTVVTKVYFTNCLLVEKRSLNFYNSLIFLNNNVFENSLGIIFPNGTIAYSQGNIASINIPNGSLPPLNDYVNDTVYKKTNS